MESTEHNDLLLFIDNKYSALCENIEVATNQQKSENNQLTMDKFLHTPTSDKKRKAESPLAPLYNTIDHSVLVDNTNTFTKLIEALEQKVDQLEISLQFHSETTESLTKENATLRQRCRNLKKHEETLQINARSMKDNVIFENILEQDDNENVRRVLIDFLQTEMQLQQNEIEAIIINRVHRMGAKGRHPRAIVANINDQGKAIIWRHTKYLKGKKFSVYNQLPKELVERKKQLLPTYKAARDKNLKPRWIGAKLLVNDTVTQVKKDRIKDINLDTTDIAASMRVKRSPPKTYNGSTFQGSRVVIDKPDDVIPAIHAIYTDVRSARATHNVYAYRIDSGQSIVEHYEDDGEYGAGRRLLGLLQSMDITDQMICVSRWHDGKNIGPVFVLTTLQKLPKTLLICK